MFVNMVWTAVFAEADMKRATRTSAKHKLSHTHTICVILIAAIEHKKIPGRKKKPSL